MIKKAKRDNTMTKYKAPSDKADEKSSSAHRSGDTADSSAAAQTPPTYGIDLADSAPIQKILMGKRPSRGVQTAPTSKQPRNGLPDNLKTGIENLSGYAMDDVKVHYNSAKPAQLQAHAYAQGTDIHLAPGQERHLPHEAWHVVQQKQGRVPNTTQFKGLAGNDEARLENKADVMGTKALHSQSATGEQQLSGSKAFHSPPAIGSAHKPRIQRKGIGERISDFFKPKDITLRDIINNRYAVPYFRQYLGTEMIQENLDFLMAVRALYPRVHGRPSYSVQDVTHTLTGAYAIVNRDGITPQSIYDEFVDANAPNALNLSAAIRTEVEDALGANDAGEIRDAYVSAYQAMSTLTERDPFGRFKNSPLFALAMKALKPSLKESFNRSRGKVTPADINFVPDMEDML
jgi:hypothetical protein